MSKAIEVKNLVKNYKDVEAVKDISFDVCEGEFFAFLGENGAGKSTTVNILCTVLEKSSGSVKIGGFDLDSQRDKIKEQIGIVFQGSVLDRQLSVRENLVSRASYYGLSKKQALERVRELTKMFDLSDILKRRYEKLSGGQRRRVDIARALIGRPKILFLDEPTTGLDPQTRVMVWNIIHTLQKETGLTIFLTTHYMEETADCDNVVILDSGKISAVGSPADLKKKYSSNRLVWYAPENERNTRLLQNEGIGFKRDKGAYKIKITSCRQAAAFVERHEEIMDFEIIKGNMDDVFLTVTGKAAGD